VFERYLDLVEHLFEFPVAEFECELVGAIWDKYEDLDKSIGYYGYGREFIRLDSGVASDYGL
jgi:hypothetical protein